MIMNEKNRRNIIMGLKDYERSPCFAILFHERTYQTDRFAWCERDAFCRIIVSSGRDSRYKYNNRESR